jgi:hypothetical protein
VNSINDRINSLFDDTTDQSKPAIVLSSVHKAKGLEWKRVFILSHTFRKGRGNQEEDNIYYVAVTRAMSELMIVGAPLAGVQKLPVEVNQDKLTAAVMAAADIHTAKHKLSADGDSCDCGCDTALCQKCGVAFCGSLTKWVNGVGNVCHKCAPPLVHTAPKLDDYDLPRGRTYHKLGNVIRLEGAELVCVSVNHSRAVFLQTANEQAKITGISPTCEAGDILRVMPKSELQVFLDRAAGRSKDSKPSPATKEKETDHMKSKASAPAKKSNTLASIVKLAKAGKTEKEMTAAINAESGPPSKNVTYLIGREWRRVNKTKGKAAPKATAKAAPKAAPKRPAKSAGKAPAKPAAKLPTPPARPSAPPPRPAPAPEPEAEPAEATAEQE